MFVFDPLVTVDSQCSIQGMGILLRKKIVQIINENKHQQHKHVL